MSELKNIVQSNFLPDGVKAIVTPEVYQLMLKQASQPRLTIPKWVAEKLDEFYTTKFFDLRERDFWLQENSITSWRCEMDYEQRFALVDAYLAGKALGVDLVKVVEV